jgi:hypothetical protein
VKEDGNLLEIFVKKEALGLPSWVERLNINMTFESRKSKTERSVHFCAPARVDPARGSICVVMLSQG